MGDGLHVGRLFNSQAFRILTVVVCHTREALSIASKMSFRAYQVVTNSIGSSVFAASRKLFGWTIGPSSLVACWITRPI